MTSVLMQPSAESRVVFYDDMPTRDEDLGYIRHQLDALAYARAVCGLRPTEETEYQRLCASELSLLEAIHHLI
jgi:hypothetical protein